MDPIAVAAYVAKKGFAELIAQINTSQAQPANQSTLDAMRELASVWTSATPSLPSMEQARIAASKLTDFFSDHPNKELGLRWDDYVRASNAYTNYLTLAQPGC